ncbi:MAG: TonB-dependent receptor [Cytophagia bacterium]|nr:MAG: TonB-dependent receptor [Runella sp.]TAG22683.1 MAG: TonB-dependent receptor [Cytophagales bacterium]TAG41849.1 MAG: TonB-dependent receptor [Cytophagia bacterium]TAG83506.1 MAG: TonB-dependent receptor [Cytophagales bacterium]
MKKGLLVGLVGLLWQSSALMAQTPNPCHCFLKGIIKDQDSGKPIAGAVVRIKENGRFAIANADGRYVIEKLCQGQYTLECKMVGYKPTSVPLSLEHDAVEESFALSEEEIHLQDVEITARKVEAPLAQTATTLQGPQLDQTRGQTLGEALKNITGVTTLQTGTSIAKPVIHGLHSNRVLIMNNGVRQEGQQWGSEHAPEIDPFVAKRLTVVKGAAGVRYGSDAVGGVVLVEPDELPNGGKINGELNTVGFSNGWQGVVSGLVQGSVNNWKGFGWRVQGTLKNGGNVATPAYHLANTGVRERNFSVAMGYRNAQRGAEVFYSQFSTILGIFAGAHIGNVSDLLAVLKNGEPFVQTDFYRQIERPYQDINHNLLKVKAFYNFKNQRLTLTFGRQHNYRAEYDLHGPQAATRPGLLFNITTFTNDLIYEHQPIAGKITGQIGLSGLYQYNLSDGRPLIPDFDQRNLGLFVIERYIRTRWEWEMGLRYDARQLDVYQFVGRVLNPRQHRFQSFSGTAGVVYNANSQLSARFNVGTAWRPPNVNELYSNGVHHGAAAFEKGDATLQPETALNATASLTYNARRLKVEMGFYRNLIDNYIYAKPQPEPILTIRGAFPYFQYVQTRAVFAGIDLTTEYAFSAKFKHQAKLSYLRAYDQQNDDFLVLIPANRSENTLNYNFGTILKSHDTFVSLTHLWVAEQRRVPPNSDFAPPPPAYHLWTVQTGGTFKVSKSRALDWGLSVQNALNTPYRDYLNRFRYFALDQGRNVSLRLKWIF